MESSSKKLIIFFVILIGIFIALVFALAHGAAAAESFIQQNQQHIYHNFDENKNSYLFADCTAPINNLTIGTFKNNIIYFDNNVIHTLSIDGQLRSKSISTEAIDVLKFYMHLDYLYIIYTQTKSEYQTYYLMKLNESFEPLETLNINEWLPVTSYGYRLKSQLLNEKLLVMAEKNELTFTLVIDLEALDISDQYIGETRESIFIASDGNEFRTSRDESWDDTIVYIPGTSETLYKTSILYESIEDIVTTNSAYIFIKRFNITLVDKITKEKKYFFNMFETFVYSIIYDNHIYSTHAKHSKNGITINRIDFELEPQGEAFIEIRNKGQYGLNNMSRIFNIDEFIIVAVQLNNEQIVFIKLDKDLDVAAF